MSEAWPSGAQWANLRPSVAAAFGFDPFERVVDFLIAQQQLQRA
jgi:hypothetical protein